MGVDARGVVKDKVLQQTQQMVPPPPAVWACEGLNSSRLTTYPHGTCGWTTNPGRPHVAFHQPGVGDPLRFHREGCQTWQFSKPHVVVILPLVARGHGHRHGHPQSQFSAALLTFPWKARWHFWCRSLLKHTHTHRRPALVTTGVKTEQRNQETLCPNLSPDLRHHRCYHPNYISVHVLLAVCLRWQRTNGRKVQEGKKGSHNPFPVVLKKILFSQRLQCPMCPVGGRKTLQGESGSVIVFHFSCKSNSGCWNWSCHCYSFLRS